MHIPTIRRAGFLAASALGLALFGALTTNSAGAATPGFCNGLAVTDFVDPLTNTFLGGGASEVIEGTEDSDTINSGGGNDTICALGGNDEVDAGTGVDWVSGGDDNGDTLNGEDGNDTLRGGGQNDILNGGDEDDDLRCGPGTSDDANGGSHINGDAFLGPQANGGCEVVSNMNP